ncbi:hypothetical protein E3U23_10450 [Erythrobacter litoralis]|uniref:hypothetical protein n=1 Tax=Erythrobacter litoralis TaxID=39960 RepID=UPI002434E898|nr:hypothetical protein [Erythrobacter litoralis]MDG6079614.1 hypothetical protein [Erythrobacter litoralis]
MRLPKTVPFVLLMAIPRTAASYAGYVLAPFLMINWLARQSWARAFFLVLFLVGSLGINTVMGQTVSLTAFLLELALILPFLAAVLSFRVARHFDGRSFIRWLNVVVAAISLIVLISMGFPWKLPYIDYLPDYYNGGFGRGGAKIVTVIGFFGVAEILSREQKMRRQDLAILLISVSNFIVPNFILGIVAGSAALAVFARRNQAIILAGAAVALVVAPYLQFRAESKNDTFSRTYGANPKLYAFKLVADLYIKEPQTILVGTGMGQFSSQPAIWASPINSIVGSHDAPDVPGLFAGDAHMANLAPVLLRFSGNRYAIESSANKPYSGISTMLAEFGLPFTLLVLYSAYMLLWHRSGHDLGRATFLFFLAMNFLDPQTDSPWFGALMLASCQAIRVDARRRHTRSALAYERESGIFLPPALPQRKLPRPNFSAQRS